MAGEGLFVNAELDYRIHFETVKWLQCIHACRVPSDPGLLCFDDLLR